MKHAKIIIISLLILCIGAIYAVSEPEELSENQMTDVSVDDTIKDKNKKNEDGSTANTPISPSPDVSSIIKNPVDDPVELNKAEVFRFENQAAEQRVNDQIRDSIKGIPPQN